MKEFILIGTLFMVVTGCQSQVHIHKHDAIPEQYSIPAQVTAKPAALIV
jgi:hypothetical protein